MSENVFTLDAMRDALKKKYEPFVLEDGGFRWTLQSPMRLSRNVRQKLSDVLDTLGDLKDTYVDENGEEKKRPVSEVESEQVAIVHQVLRLVAQGDADVLISKLVTSDNEPDLVALMWILEQWQDKVQPGEASDSPA